jgi:hypothetical protein
MAKKGPIGKVEAFYIDHHYQLLTPTDLANELDRTVRSIELYIKKNHTDNKKSTTTIKENNSNQLTAGDQFIRKDGVVIMTENASTISDEVKKYSKKTLPNHRITKIK